MQYLLATQLVAQLEIVVCRWGDMAPEIGAKINPLLGQQHDLSLKARRVLPRLSLIPLGSDRASFARSSSSTSSGSTSGRR